MYDRSNFLFIQFNTIFKLLREKESKKKKEKKLKRIKLTDREEENFLFQLSTY